MRSKIPIILLLGGLTLSCATTDERVATAPPHETTDDVVERPERAAPTALPPDEGSGASGGAGGAPDSEAPWGVEIAMDDGAPAADAPGPAIAVPSPSPPPVPVHPRVLIRATAAAAEPISELPTVEVYYGTNRARGSACAAASVEPGEGCVPNHFYGGESGDLEVGTLQVTFPPQHRAGRLERPLGIWRIRLPENPEDHVMLARVDPFGGDEAARARWVQALRESGHEEAFLYIHGYATAFDDASRRAAQIAYDLDFQGLPILFSWPSKGGIAGYGTDGPEAELATDSFDAFLDLVHAAGIRDLHVIAHSMGNRLITNALLRRSDRGRVDDLFDQLVLAAPDIDAAVFERRFAQVLPRFARRVTLYVSDRDRALKFSGGLRQRPRAGQRRGNLLGLLGLDTIDATAVETDFLSHSYYADNETVLADLYCLLRGSPAAGRPLLVALRTPLGEAWRIKSPDESRRGASRADQCPPAGAEDSTAEMLGGGTPGDQESPGWSAPETASAAAAILALLAGVGLAARRWQG